jgi:hypothetical protein
MHPIENEFLQVVGDDELLDVAVKRIIHTHIMLQPPTEEELRVVDA